MPKVEFGTGWGAAKVGATYAELVAAFGEPDATQPYDDCSFPEWHRVGLQVNVAAKSTKATAIFVYANDPESPQFQPADATTDRGVTFGADEAALVAAHGAANKRYGGEEDDGTTWARLAYDGGDARFVNGKLVRFAIEKAKRKK